MTSTDKPNTTESPPDQQGLEQLARASLDDSVAHLDAATLSQLNRARQQALAEAEKPFLQWHWLSIGATTCAVIALAITLPLLQSGEPEVIPGVDEAYYGTAEDAELVEDLDLVLWLMENEDHAS